MTKKTVFALLLSLTMPWQAASARASTLTAETRSEVVEGLVELLEELYVIPETASQLQNMLRQNLADGAYDAETSPQAWAATLTRELQALSHDKHLRVSFADSSSTQGAPDAPVRVRRSPGSGSDGGVFQGVRGIAQAEVLPGNIGYVDIRLFVPREQGESIAVEAMETVQGTDALLFDLRTCMGGVPEMVHFVTSYLYPPEPFHLLTYHYAAATPQPAYTLAEIPGVRMPDVPVYLLTSSLTGSGCEEFSYVLKHHGRGTVVGETTGGAGHGGGVHPVAAGFSAFIPDFRPVHPVTGAGWEVVGVAPDVAVPADRALYTAQKLALETIVESSPEAEGGAARRAELSALIADLENRIVKADEPLVYDAEALAEYVGSYEIRTITLEESGLHLQRTGGPKLLMLPADEPDTFTLKRVPQARLRFERDAAGAITELHVLGMSGTWEVSKRG